MACESSLANGRRKLVGGECVSPGVYLEDNQFELELTVRMGLHDCVTGSTLLADASVTWAGSRGRYRKNLSHSEFFTLSFMLGGVRSCLLVCEQ